MVRLVLFDIDGTLIHTGGAGEQAFARVCASEFHIPNGAECLHFAGRTDPAIAREFFQRHHIEPSQENFRRFFDRYVFWLDHLLGQLAGRVLPGVRELLRDLRALAQRPVLGLLTGNIRLGAQIKLSHYRLWEHFQTGGFGDDHEDRNQIAAIARARGNRLLGNKLRGEEILVIGDTPHDIACARAIDAKVLAVATGRFGLQQLKEHGPTWAVKDLQQMTATEICL
jgi:phosphoglycolate phosphatase-like HAD superfamily hydrolase